MSVGRLSPTSAQDPNPSVVSYRGDVEPPTTSYAASINDTALGQHFNAPSSQVWTRAPFVQRAPMRPGIMYAYAHGGEEMPLPFPYPGGGDGFVWSSLFQRIKIHLFNYVQYRGLFMGGYPRNLGLTFRTEQIKTQTTGGPWAAKMGPKNIYGKVQVIPRYSTVPPAYPTKSANS